ncbi:MAG: helix-turn-helix domain-containing protein [Ruminococcaceae bacterium]|nr:helix-turn-helix domain-containing protein [Oscillospiraceae bacterium]
MLSFDEKQFTEISEDFFNITKLKINLYDANFNLVCAPATHAPFCSVVRKNQELTKKCIECDRYGLGECKRRNKLIIYKCHMGLTEACVPITQDNVVIGYLMLGQTLEECDRESIERIVSDLPSKYDKEQLRDALSLMKPLSNRSLLSAARIMEMCACYLWIKNIVSVQQSTLQNNILTFINQDLSSDELTVEGLCRRFNISRSLLYSISKKTLGMGISEYVRKCRIEAAKEMLMRGNVPIYRIASDCGFSSPSYFTKVFCEQVGCLPKEYPQKYKDLPL